MGTICAYHKTSSRFNKMFFIKNPDRIIINVNGISTCFPFESSGITWVPANCIITRVSIPHVTDCLMISDKNE